MRVRKALEISLVNRSAYALVNERLEGQIHGNRTKKFDDIGSTTF